MPMQIDITRKLAELLGQPGFKFTNEAEVVYFLVELRKILDRHHEATGVSAFQTVRFYADWSVHTAKSKITPAIQVIMELVDKSVPQDIAANHQLLMTAEHLEFIYARELRNEIIALMRDLGLPDDVFVDEEGWLSFVGNLVKVLADQPIQNPVPNISSFCFRPAAEGAVIWEIEFKDQRGFTKFGNAF